MLYWFIKIIFTPLLFFFFKPKIYGRKNLKTKGRLLVVSNHKSNFDPVLVSYIFGRKIRWMAKSELFKNAFATWFLKKVDAFPVRRGAGDFSSIRHAMRILHNGQVLGIFPEGTRIKNSELGAFEPGMAMMALKTDSPVLPIYIKGNYGLFRRVKVVVGEVIDLNAYTGRIHTPAAVAHATEHLFTRVNMLSDMVKDAKS